MQEKPYAELSDAEILTLCCWREARGEPLDVKIAQCWSVKNRVLHPGWWGHDWHSVILKPWQYSSFNRNDPNEKKWPPDDPNDQEYESGQQAQQAAEAAMAETTPDPTDGATNYYDTSIEFPKAWGSEAEWENTLTLGRLRFWKMRPVHPADLSLQGDV